MSYKPVMTGGVVVEVNKDEFEKLVRESEKIAAVERLINENRYTTTNDIAIILGIERKENLE